MSDAADPIAAAMLEMAAEETWASLAEALPAGAAFYHSAHSQLTSAAGPAGAADAMRQQCQRHGMRLLELCRNLDLLATAASDQPLVAHMAAERPLLRALADSLLLASALAAPQDAAMLPLAEPAQIESGLRRTVGRGWFAGPAVPPAPDPI